MANGKKLYAKVKYNQVKMSPVNTDLQKNNGNCNFNKENKDNFSSTCKYNQ